MKTRLTNTVAMMAKAIRHSLSSILSFGRSAAICALLGLVSVATAQTPIVCGQTVTKTTTAATQIDQYSYVGTAGQVLALGLSGPIDCGFGRYMVADVYSPSGQLLTTVQALCDGGGGGRLTLTTTGTYTILVHEVNYAATGSYSLSVQLVTAGGCGRSIVCGQSVGTNTTYKGQLDAYSYVGTAGQVLALGLSGPIDCGFGRYMVADVYSPSGQLLTTVQALCDGGGGGRLTLTTTGTYTILVHEVNYAATGSYSLSVQLVTAGGCGRSIVCGQSVGTNTTYKGQLDAYSYVGTAGQVLALGLSGPIDCGFGRYMVADVYSPSGQLLTTVQALCDGGGGGRLTLTTTGTYTILVHEVNYAATGSYSLSVQLVTAGGCGRSIVCGQSVGTNTTYKGQLDAYSYVGTAGQVLALGLSGPIDCGFGRYMVADVYSPSGQLLTTVQALCDGGGGGRLTLTTTGTYTILVHEVNYAATGSYALSIQSATGGGCNSAPIVCGQSVSTNISKHSEIRAHGFGTGGGTVILSFGGFGGVQFDLYDPVGNKLFTRSPGTATNIALAAGTYTLLVHADNYTDTGSYSFSATCLSPCNYLITPTGGSVGAAGTNDTVGVTAGVGCNWTATTNANWLKIANGASGSGNGTVSYLVEANTSTNARVGTMTIAGWTYMVNQAGAVGFVGHDIGDPGVPGSFSYSNGVYIVSGSGEDIEETADDFYFVHQPLTGDGQIVAHVTSLVATDPTAEAGVMIRESLNAGAKHAFLRVDTKTNAVFRRRLTNDEPSVENVYAPTNRPWLLLMRMGNTFVAHCSTNGTNWEYVWFTTVNMSNQVQIGMAVTAHHNGSYATGTLDNVSIGSLTPLPTWPLPAPMILMGGEPWTKAEFQRVGGFKFLLGSVAGDYFTIKGTTNLGAPSASWPALGTVTNTYGVLPFLDVQALTNASQFYRMQRSGP